MVLTQQELIILLRQAVNVDNTDVEDSEFLKMSDEDLTLFLKLSISKVFPAIDEFEDLPSGSGYPVVLVAKKELYLKLAVSKANLIDLTADNNNQLKQSQRFSHYMALAENAQEEYEDWVENGGGLTDETGVQGINTYNVLLSRKHYSNRNYELGRVPIVKVKVGVITNDSIEFSWSSVNNDHFGKYLVYISKNPIVDLYQSGTTAESKVIEGAKLIKSTLNMRDTFHRVTGLEEDTEYHIAVFSVERNSLFGVREVTFKTLAPFVAGEEVSVSDIGGGLSE